MTEWLKEKKNWDMPHKILYSVDIVEDILAGPTPDVEACEWSFLAIVSAVLNHIRSFEMLTNSKHLELWTAFTNRMSASLHRLDQMCNEQIGRTSSEVFLPKPVLHCTRALLDLAFYHLYASPQLSRMKRLLQATELLGVTDDVNTVFEQQQLEVFKKALLRAAVTLRVHCRMGVRYVQQVAPHIFSPLSNSAITDGGMLSFT